MGVGAGIRSRAARFLGGSHTERAEIADLVRDIYSLRSLAVHSGKFDGSDAPKRWRDEISVLNAIKAGQTLVGRSLVEIVRKGEPDWEKFDICN
jgi:hypothetical protein